MSLHRSSECNESLNSLFAAIQHGSHGLIRDLSLDLIEDGNAAVRGVSPSYYGVQLVLHTTKLFHNKHGVFAKIQLLLSVGGSTLELIVARPDDDDDDDDLVSTRDDACRPQLMFAATAEPRGYASQARI